jgi:hypothetical protein
MTHKAEQIRDKINVTSSQIAELNITLRKSFETSDYRGKKIEVDCTSEKITIKGSDCPMTREEALLMAKWIIEMLEESDR